MKKISNVLVKILCTALVIGSMVMPSIKANNGEVVYIAEKDDVIGEII